MKRTVIVGAAAAIVGALVGAVALRPGPSKSRDDYCGSAEQVLAVPSMRDEGAWVTAGFESLVAVEGAIAVDEAPDGRLFVVTKQGVLWQATGGASPPERVLDLTDEVATTTEQGLLGVAVHPDGTHLYVDGTFTDDTARLLELALTPDGLDLASRREVLSIDDPNPSHNGGRLAFDGEGRLVFGIGDGGDGDATGAAQDLGSLFGKLLRIDPRPTRSAPYAIPDDNPFVGIEGARGEVLASGFRNPWGWSIDPDTDALWVGDVGQLCREEVSMAPDAGRGQNFGWPYVEGAHVFEGPVLGPGGEPDDNAAVVDLGRRPDDLVAPLLEYPHGDSSCSVIGGVVYRGSAIPELGGVYLWADLCERSIRTLRQESGEWVRGTFGGTVPAGIVALTADRAGEVLVVSMRDGVHRLTAP